MPALTHTDQAVGRSILQIVFLVTPIMVRLSVVFDRVVNEARGMAVG